jgi:hypothetical protein
MGMSAEVVSSLSPQAARRREEVATRARKSVVDRRMGARSFQENQEGRASTPAASRVQVKERRFNSA